MAATPSARQRQAVEYGRRLRVALDETGTSIYRLARLINSESPESERSNLQRYLRGAVLPGATKRYEIAHALTRPELLHAPGDEEEDRQVYGGHEEMLAALAVALEPYHPSNRMAVKS